MWLNFEIDRDGWVFAYSTIYKLVQSLLTAPKSFKDRFLNIYFIYFNFVFFIYLFIHLFWEEWTRQYPASLSSPFAFAIIYIYWNVYSSSKFSLLHSEEKSRYDSWFAAVEEKKKVVRGNTRVRLTAYSTDVVVGRLHDPFWQAVPLKYIVDGDPKALFSIATTPMCREERYYVPWIAPLYRWSFTL